MAGPKPREPNEVISDIVYNIRDYITCIPFVNTDTYGSASRGIGVRPALKVGQPVAVIGNALDLGIIMTGGWGSRLKASVSGPNNVQMEGLIETDAAINQGNSGGPLITGDEVLVGITNEALVQTATDPDVEGIYYAISIDSAMPTIQSLISRLP